MGKSFFTAPAAAQSTPFVSDQSQQRVLDLPVQDSAVIWGAPGTGKTATLTELVARRVEAGENPDHLLVLSPNRSASTRLRDQLAARIGHISQNALARTPSSLAFSILTADAQRRATELPVLLTGNEQDFEIKELIEGNIFEGTGPQWPEPLVEDVRRSKAFRTELRDLFSRAAELGWHYEQLLALAKSTNRPAWAAAAEFWKEYEEVLLAHRVNSFDSASLLNAATLSVSQAAAGQEALPELKTVYIDDAQELTYGAVRLVKALAERGANVVACGDPDISASTFRGAYPQFLGRFAESLGLDSRSVSTVVLEKVHRHPAEIRSLVAAVSQKIGTAEAGRQHQATSVAPSAHGAADHLVTIVAHTPSAEVAELARRLRREHLMSGIPLNRMTVIVRNGSMVASYARALSTAEVPTRTLVAERTLKEQPTVLDLVLAVKIALRPETEFSPDDVDMVMSLLVSPIVGLSHLDVRRLRLALRHEGLSQENSQTGSELLAVAVRDTALLENIDFAPARTVLAFAETLRSVSRQAVEGAPIEELLWTVWHNSALEKRWVDQALSVGLMADDANRNLDAVMALFTSAKRFTERNPGRPAADFVESLLSAEVPEDSLAPQSQTDAVLVTTPSGVIGAEFDVVVVAGLQENVWPNLRPRGSLLNANELLPDIETSPAVAVERADQLIGARKTVLDDELRYFTLATSRATLKLIISALEYEDSLPSPLFFVAQSLASENYVCRESQRPPLSLRGLTGALRRQLTHTLSDGRAQQDAAPQLATALARLAAAEIPGANPESWYGLIEPSTTEPLFDTSSSEQLVPVSPSNLEKFEDNKLAWFIDSVIGFNTSTSQGIGTIVHAVMEKAANYPVDKLAPDLLMQEIEQRWHELSFETDWLSLREMSRVTDIAAALSQYLTSFVVDGKKLLAPEGGFALEVGPAQVRGYVDRIEEDLDGVVVIVDLKTSKYPPAKKDVPENAQMACYQLALVSGALTNSAGEPIDSVRNGGAKLLYWTDGKKERVFTAYEQKPYTAQDFERIRNRITSAAIGMAQHEILANIAIREEKGDPYSRYEYRIHTVRAVSE